MNVARDVFAAGILLAIGGSGLEAQTGLDPVYPRPSFMVGYVANAPQQLLGGGALALPPGLAGWGGYVDAKMGLNSPADDPGFMPQASRDQAEEAGHVQQSDRSHWTSFNAAAVRAFRADVILYLGAGMSKEEVYLEFFDATQEQGRLGYYWFLDEVAWRPNVLGGMFFRIARHVSIQFGAEATPPGFTVGALAVF